MKQIIMCMVFILSYCQLAWATPVTILSSEYHVWGNIDGIMNEVSGIDILSSQAIHREYDEISSMPLQRSVDANDFGIYSPYTASRIDSFHLTAEATSIASSGTIGSTTYSYFPSGNAGTENDAFAEGVWDFNVLEPVLNIDFNLMLGPYAGSSVWLSDLTTGFELFYGVGAGAGELVGTLLSDPFVSDTIGQINISIPVDISHEYRLRMYAEAESAGDVDSVTFSADVYSVSVPEPATIFLLAVSFIGVFVCKRKFGVVFR